MFCATGSPSSSLSNNEIRQFIDDFVDHLGERNEVLLLPPDYTRIDSQAGMITRMICERYGYIPSSSKDTHTSPNSAKSIPKIEIIPALGTHAPMTSTEIEKMFGNELAEKDPTPFLVHDWRKDVVQIGEAPAQMVREATQGKVDQPWPAQVNRRIWEKRIINKSSKTQERTAVLSIGQVVPHEVMGMANYNKNLFVGTGGVEAIGLSHFIGAVYGMERMMGRKDNPLRAILNHASKEFLEEQLDLWYVLTVVGPDDDKGDPCVRGLYIGKDIQCYNQACDLSRQVNVTLLEKPIARCVVYLKEEKFHSTWLGNKAIYRTRMAMADGGDLIILAPGVSRFGEDSRIDKLVRKHGYKGTQNALDRMNADEELKDELSTVAHLIHGSTEGRFQVTYCPGHLSRQEIESVGFQYADVSEMQKQYNPEKLCHGWNMDEKGEFFFVRDPALGLWAHQARFEEAE